MGEERGAVHEGVASVFPNLKYNRNKNVDDIESRGKI
jgi:hypothetical protein